MRLVWRGLAAGLGIAAVACGSESHEPGVPLAMQLTVPDHLGIVSLRLTVFDQNGTCDADGDADGNALPDLADMPLPIGQPTEIKVSPGRRTFFVVGYDGDDDAVARGCAQETLSPNAQADVTITLAEYPGTPDAAPDAAPADAGPDAEPRPPGDSCADPLTITAGAITGGSSTNALDDFAPSCGGAGDADLVYSLTLAADQRVRVTATATGGTLDPALSIRSTCDASATEVACADLSTGATEMVDVQQLSAGTYFIIVDGGAGTFDLLVELLPVPPANDRCTGAVALVEGTPALGTTADASDDTADACGGAGVEVFYTFTLATERRVVLDLTEMGGSHGFSLRATCGDPGTELGCAVGGTLDVLALAAGTYTVVVEADGATGPFGLVLNTFDPVPNDTCGSPTTLGTPSTTLAGESSVGAGDDEDGTCAGGGASPDIVYTYTLTEARHVNLSVTSDYNAALSIRTPTCADEPSEISCVNASAAASGGTETIDIRTQPAGTYYVVVDGVGSGEGLADVTLTTSPPPPPGDACPEVLTLPTGTSASQSLTAGYADDASGTCGGAGGLDRVYSFSIVGARHVNIATQATFAHHIYLRSASCTAGAESGCQTSVVSGGGTQDATLDFPNLAGGTYYLFVDGNGAAAAGAFDVTLTVTSPVAAPPNDTCAGATLLTEGLAIPGTLDAATNNLATSCIAGSATDVFYRFTLATNRLVTISLTSSIDTGMTLFSGATCGTIAELDCENATTGGEVLVNENLPAGTYYIAVEGVAGATGGFNIGYTTSTPIIRPPNDTCSGVIALASGTPRTGDNTLNSLDNRDGTCGDTVSGDVVYAVTVPPGMNRRVRATVSNANGFDPVLYLQSGACGTGTEVACAQTSVGDGDVLDIPSLAPGTYYLWVDTLGGSVAPATFDIVADILTAVPPPSNDTCAAPDALVAGTAENHATVGATDDYALSCITFDGRDTVHSFDTTALGARAVLVTVDPVGWNAAIALRSGATCATGPDLSCVSEGWDARYINRPNLAGGLYDVLVDGDLGASGDYSIKYEVRPADTSFGYWAIDTTGTFTPLTGATPVTIGLTAWGVDGGTGAGDEWTAPVTLPFTFDYYGTGFTSVNVSANGFLTFNAAPAGAENYTNDCPLGSSIPNNTIAPFWDDGVTVTEYPSQLLTKVEGIAPNRRFIIEFRDWDILSCNTMGNCYRMNVRMNQQTILHENGDIEFRYGPRQTATLVDRNCAGGSGGATFDHGFGRCATIGIEGQVMATTDADQIQCNSATPTVTDGRVIYFVYPR